MIGRLFRQAKSNECPKVVVVVVASCVALIAGKLRGNQSNKSRCYTGLTNLKIYITGINQTNKYNKYITGIPQSNSTRLTHVFSNSGD